ncbi:MAG: DUF2075 domain-containing protein [Euryarchaeota archaeon]|nr:DUF2075 domain-containing protein [Euryarchaeota archaeon]MDE2044822.1 DUF2075 domain-containing protein [Thermoplasmata archaeon]
MLEERCAWAGHFDQFVGLPDRTLFSHLTRFTREKEPLQLGAWRDSLEALQREAGECIRASPVASGFGAVLEYKLSVDRARRPDVVVLENGSVVVLEFKSTAHVRQADLDQVAGYARDLEGYHEASQNRHVIPVLIPMRFRSGRFHQGSTWICPPNELAALLLDLTGGTAAGRADIEKWVRSEFVPLPKLVESARLIFERSPLPFIRRVSEAGIPNLIERMLGVCREAAQRGQRHLILLSGVPGSGKTLAGLQLVHHPGLDIIATAGSSNRAISPAVFLSGNGPLVKVLRHALGSKVFVTDIWTYLRKNLEEGALAPREHVVVFDEAQRAWDHRKVFDSHDSLLGDRSEPQLLLESCEKVRDWCTLVGLFGEGQEIHSGEEGGIQLWIDAVSKKDGTTWFVHGPERWRTGFEAVGASYDSAPEFDLTQSIRSHLAVGSAAWASLLLSGRLGEARNVVSSGLREFPIYATRSLEDAKSYVHERYRGEGDGYRWGLLASSKARNLSGYGVRNDWMSTKVVNHGAWYNDAPTAPKSCCQLQDVVTEFGCQGLELDLPLVCWGDDLVWSGTKWTSDSKPSKGVEDALRLRLNAYRVLLTRGRDGICIFVPESPKVEMDSTYRSLLDAGVSPLLPGVSEAQSAQ